ncbi:MAG: S8/S53 family peptidase [Saprospiraceae bacterium]|nr:S8/S53 family peptidase [Saprospiraceae bacterium]
MDRMSLLWIFFLLCFETSAPAQPRSNNFVPDELLVQLEENTPPDKLLQILPESDGLVRLKKTLSKTLGIHLLSLDPAVDEYAFKRRLSRMPEVIYAGFNYRIRSRSRIPDDPLFNRQWPLEVIRAPLAWEIGTGGITKNGDTIVVAVLDTGFELDHEDLRENFWINREEIPNDGIDNDGNGYTDDYRGLNIRQPGRRQPADKHGTSVAGIIGARGDNGIGIAGINWHVKMLTISPVESEAEIIEAYQYIFELRKKYNDTNGENGAFVVVANLSGGLDRGKAEDFPLWCSMYDLLGSEGILSIGAATNSRIDIDKEGDMPASCTSDFLITVTSTTEQDGLGRFASFGPKSIDIGAPGESSFSTTAFDGYTYFAGTSAAAPHLAGSVALLYSFFCEKLAIASLAQPATVASLTKRFILDGSDGLNALFGLTVSGGRINLRRSYEEVRQYCNQVNSVSLSGIAIYPNPSRNTIFIESGNTIQGPVEIIIYDVMGKMVMSKKSEVISSVPIAISLANLKAGWYSIEIFDNGGRRGVFPFVLQESF